MTTNLEAVRRLLTDAFSSGEIKTLAFDRVPEVYESVLQKYGGAVADLRHHYEKINRLFCLC